jgi:acetyltransferase-like isoleucine patch superfamily enzyme
MKRLFYRFADKIFKTILKFQGMEIKGRNCHISYKTDIINPSRMKIFNNTVIYKNVSIYIGNNGYFEMNENSHISSYCYFLIDDNKFIIGNNVGIGPYTSFFCHSNHYSADVNALFINEYIDGDIIIGSNVFIGAQCVVLPGTIIENKVIVGANSTIKGRLESGYIYGGSPARKIKLI